MPYYDVGARVYKQAQAVATLSLSPLNDRALIVTRILIDKPSAADQWTVNIAGREVARFDIQTVGNQQPLSGPYSGYPKNNDFFKFFNDTQVESLIYPVPNGQTITVASVGGATANIQFEYQEVRSEEILPSMMNHPYGKRFVLPLVGYRAANVTAVGEQVFDSQIGPNWFPNLFVDNDVPSSWNITVLGVFLEGGGRNTFSGAADHQSVTSYFEVIKDGLRYFTRDMPGGIPMVGQASAAGSANTVVGSDASPVPPFQETDFRDSSAFDIPLKFGPGDAYQFRFGVTGDVTGGATFAAMRQMLLCDVRIA